MRTSEGSQRRFPAVLAAVLAAAALYRGATILTGPRGGESSSLVSWRSAQEAVAVSARERKAILYDFNAEWCGPCHRLEEAVFADPESARFINRSFVPVSVVDRQQEDGHNPPLTEELQKKYAISAFPTLVLVSSDGRLLGKLEGFPGSERVMEFLKER